MSSWYWVSKIVIIILALTVAQPAFSIGVEGDIPVLTLYRDNGQPTSEYNQAIAFIENHFAKRNPSPVSVVFSHGLTYTVYDAYKGGQNLLLDIGNGELLRIRKIPQRRFSLFQFYRSLNMAHLVDSLQVYLEGYKILKDKNVPVPNVRTIKGYEKQFAVIEKLNIEFLYVDYLTGELNVSDERLREIDQDLINFARKTAIFSNIGDFGGKQLAYTDKGWILIDFSNNTDFITHRSSPNVFEQSAIDNATNTDLSYALALREVVAKPGLPARIRNRILEVISLERQRISDRDINNGFKDYKNVNPDNPAASICSNLFIN